MARARRSGAAGGARREPAGAPSPLEHEALLTRRCAAALAMCRTPRGTAGGRHASSPRRATSCAIRLLRVAFLLVCTAFSSAAPQWPSVPSSSHAKFLLSQPWRCCHGPRRCRHRPRQGRSVGHQRLSKAPSSPSFMCCLFRYLPCQARVVLLSMKGAHRREGKVHATSSLSLLHMSCCLLLSLSWQTAR